MATDPIGRFNGYEWMREERVRKIDFWGKVFAAAVMAAAACIGFGIGKWLPL